MDKKFITTDGNTAAANAAYAFSEVAAIYPITPASPMGELADYWSSVQNKKNIFGQPVEIIEMESEGGASGAVHGSLSGGALTTTFTASQGLLLMLPNMFKIAGEMLPAVFHIASRSLACQSLSIFGDHSDVMATRGTGFALLSSSSVQEAQDLAAIAHLSAIESRVPFLHFFDGFRTSHEIQKIETIDYETLKSMVNFKAIELFKKDALNPEHPYAKVGAENPDVYFQGRETVNKYYQNVPEIVKKYFDLFYEKTGRKYSLFEYVGHPKAEKIIVSMGSSCETIEEAVNYLVEKGEKVGAVKVKLYRPFSIENFERTIPESVKKIAVLDRTKEPGSIGEPLYLDVVSALKERKDIKIIGGRYGLSSKEFNPTMVKAVYDHLDGKCFHGFTVGINDDVTNLSIPLPEEIDTEQKEIVRCKFWGLGSDGTVGANKNSIKIIGDNTEMKAQGYFSYDSKKSGGITISYLRFGPKKIQSPYLPTKFDFIALHNHSFIGRYDILEGIKENGTFLINSPWKPEEVFEHLTKKMQEEIIEKKVKVYTINANKIANEIGLGRRINIIMQTAFFKLTKILDEEQAINLIKEAIQKTFGKKGEKIVEMNYLAVDKSSNSLEKVEIPETTDKFADEKTIIGSNEFEELPPEVKVFAKDIIEPIMHLKGDSIPVSKMPLNGAVPTGTSKLEKRGTAEFVPRWDSKKCIQCGICAMSCPHSAIRIKQIEPEELKNKPETFETIKSNTKNSKNLQFKVQIYPEDCVGCGVCVNECPVKALEMKPIEEERKRNERENAEFFDKLPDNITEGAENNLILESQLKVPLFEFSGACAGCGETPYIRLLTQLFGENMIIANATGCSSIYGGTFPTIPYSKTKEGKGPAWANSLFEDNAEYGLGIRLAVEANRNRLFSLITKLSKSSISQELKNKLDEIINKWTEKIDNKLAKEVKEMIKSAADKENGENKALIEEIISLEDYFQEKSVWSVGGDGWAYDIGYGGLDHSLAKNRKLKALVLDSEVYSNTGGQASKATPYGAVAKFAAAGKRTPKKNLGLMMMSYGYIYVASISMGANRIQAIKAITEAENYPGPSIVIAYCPCIAHGLDMSKTQQIEKEAVQSEYWPLYRFNPDLAKENKNPFIWDSPTPSLSFQDYINKEIRYTTLKIQFPEKAEKLYKMAEEIAKERYKKFEEYGENNSI